MGLLLAVVITAANVNDARAAQEVFGQMPGTDFPRLETIQADNSYHSPALDRWLRVHHRPYRIWVVSRPPGEREFKPLRSRWVVERTFAWLGHSRRLSKDYERLCATSEAMIYATVRRLMVRRLATP
jgi:putative transposase